MSARAVGGEIITPFPIPSLTPKMQKQLRAILADGRRQLAPPKTETQKYYERYIMIFGKKIVYKRGREPEGRPIPPRA